MKSSRSITLIIIIAILGLSWFSFLSTTIKQITVLSGYTSKAEESVKLGLYEQAIEFYHDALEERTSKKYYNRMKEIYEVFYKEEASNYVRTLYIDDMLLAAEDYPKDASFWNAAIKLQLDAKDYSDAYDTVKKAINMGAGGEQLNKYNKQLMYMEKVEYKIFTEVHTTLNGYNTVSTGSNWYVIDNDGQELTEQYPYVGLINDEGYGIFNTGKEIRLLDKDQIVRSRFGNLKVDKAGYYSASSEIFPALIGEKWSYINKDGKKIEEGYDIAGSFYNHQAVASKEGKWELINDKGEKKALNHFTDIKLDLYGCHQQGEVVIAKEGNKYHLYDSDFKRIGKFEADDIDICVNNGLIAFKSGGKWGFVDTAGKVVVEPKYKQAKSFANGYAAVCGDNGLWGFINDKHEMVISAKFMNAYYFNKDETCFISKDGETYQLMRFMFD